MGLQQGWTENDYALDKFAKRFTDLTDPRVQDQLGKYRDMLDMKSRLQEQARATEKMKGDAKNLAEQLATPLEKYREEKDKIDEMERRGYLTTSLAERARGEARKRAIQGMGADFGGTTGALDIGKRIQDMLLKAGNEKLMEQQLKEQEKTNTNLTQLPKNIANEINAVGAFGLGP